MDDLELPRRDDSGVKGIMTFQRSYQSEKMDLLQRVYSENNDGLLQQLVFESEDIIDPDEAIAVMFMSCVIMNQPDAFRHIVKKNNKFKFKPTWHILFS